MIKRQCNFKVKNKAFEIVLPLELELKVLKSMYRLRVVKKWIVTLAVVLMAVGQTLTIAQAAEKSIEQVVRQVKASHKGKVLSARKEQFRGQEVYKIKMLSPDSKVYYLIVDPSTGRVLSK